MKFCSHCGAPLVRRIPPGDDRPRAVCEGCGTIHYENPRAVVGCLIEHKGGILLCRRAIEPARGRWTAPAGFLELGESAPAGALRETREEALAEAAIQALFCQLDLPHIGQSYLFYRARLLRETFAPGSESLEVGLFEPAALPWGELAFPVVDTALRLFLEDMAAGLWRSHHGLLRWSGEGSRYDAANYRLEEHLAVPLAASNAPAQATEGGGPGPA